VNEILQQVLADILPEGMMWGDPLTPQVLADTLANWDAAKKGAAQMLEQPTPDTPIINEVAPVRADTPTLFCVQCGVNRLNMVCDLRENCGLVGIAHAEVK